MHDIEEVKAVIAAFEAAIPLATLVSPEHETAFLNVRRGVQTLLEVCAHRRPVPAELCRVWQTLRGLPDWQNTGWATAAVATAAEKLGIAKPSWTPPQEAFDMLGKLACAASLVVLAVVHPTRGGFSASNAEKEASCLGWAREEIEGALLKARALGLVI